MKNISHHLLLTFLILFLSLQSSDARVPISKISKRVLLQLYWSAQKSDFVTVEKKSRLAKIKLAKYRYVHDQGYALSSAPKDSPDLMPLELYWHAGNRDYYLTATNAGIKSAASGKYKHIRTIAYVYVKQMPGTIALQQFWHAAKKDSFLAITNEDILKANTDGYKYIRTEGYVYPPKNKPDPTITDPTDPSHTLVSGIIKSNPSRHHFINKVQLKNNGYNANKIVIILGYPQDNQYQSVENIQSTPGAEVLTAKGTDTKYIRFTLQGNDLPAPGQTKMIGYEADVTLYEISRSFNGDGVSNHTNQPADLAGFTGANLPYVDPDHSQIRNQANTIWAQSGNKIVTFARLLYNYTGQHFRYQNANTGMYALTDILNNGGGDCGNLSSVFISYMRSKGVPARHLVGIRADNLFHAWAEFHDPGYGWIPLDVTYINSDPNGDYLGRIAARDKAIILHPDVNLEVEKQPGVYYTAAILQGYLWWVWAANQNQGSVDGQLVPTQMISVRPY